jgi:hypothetical protein
MASIGIAFNDSLAVNHNVVITDFTGQDFPRQYANNASFEYSANGSHVLGGPAYRQKYIWTIAAVIPTADALALDALFVAWDTDRAAGKPVACGITDETFGASVTTNAVFSTSPSYTYMGGNLTLVAFGMSEV